tara:strand:+ start:1640 stop:2122 length:483 start_codon:yes stop_codon:yes gene_type:complete
MIYTLLNNEVLAWSLIACGLAQLSKLLVKFIQKGELNFKVLFETGGMPSSHSALVTATASGVGLKEGFDDPIFALAVTVAFIIMYDASGVRQEAGKIATVVNNLTNKSDIKIDKLLKESLGHTRIEVIIGSIIGPLIALPGIYFLGSPVKIYSLMNYLIN